MEENHQEKIFNLQLIVQKLEEELLLYRNGTSVTELLELIHEKDVEIETLNIQNEEKAQKLKKLAKTSGEVLIKYENIQIELQKKQDMIYELEEFLKSLQNIIKEKDEIIKDLKTKQQQFSSELKIRDERIGVLELEKWELKESLEKNYQSLQEQYTKLQSTHQTLEESTKTMEVSYRSLQEEYQLKANAFHTYEKESPILKEQLELFESQVIKYKELLKESDANIEKLQNRCALLIQEKNDKFKSLETERQEMINNIQQFRDAMNSNITQRDDALRRKDEKIRELTFQVTVLQQELKNKQLYQQQQQLESQGKTSASTVSASTEVAAKISSSSSSSLPSARPALSERTNSLDV